MTPRRFTLLLGTLLIGNLLCVSVRAQDAPPSPPTPMPPEGIDVLTRGPVHEGYAEPGEVRPQASPLVPKAPPEPINELPPEQRPEGENVQWIPGYWAWDQEKNNYLWVSGFWRIPPPHRQWMPGTWQEVEGGWHWVAGFWGPAGQEDWQYLPTPPPSPAEAPATPAPQADSTYVPGCWIYRENRFWWRPGFWSMYHPGWVWIPAHYVWTPSGCLFIEGYWDHPLEARGLLFAPIRLANRLVRAERWTYTPQFVVQPDFLMSALFVQPRACHYYFGDYFEDRYRSAGFVPWMDYRIGGTAYDPNFNYYRVTFAGYGKWERGLRNLYQARYQGDIPRPPRTLIQQREMIERFRRDNVHNAVVNRNLNLTNLQNSLALTPLTQLHNTRVTNLATLAHPGGRGADVPAFSGHVLRLQEVPREQRLQEQKAASQLHAVAQERRKMEANILSEGPPVRVTDRPRQGKVTLPARPGESHAAPRPGERPLTPRPGETVRPTPPVQPRPEGRRPTPPVTPHPGNTPPPPGQVRPGERPPAPAPSRTPRPPVTVPQHRAVPPPPAPPRHEDRPIPKHEAPRPPAPPQHAAPPHEPARPPAPPKQPTPPPPPHKKK